MKTFNICTAIALTASLSGCSSFAPTEGMSVRQVSREAYVPCQGSQKINDEHLVLVGNHPGNPDIQIYNTAAHVKFKRANPDCQKNLYFYNDKLINDAKVAELVEQHKQFMAQKAAAYEAMVRKRAEVIKNLESYILQNRLTVLEEFRNKDFSEFRIYRDVSNKFYYSINYEFVNGNSVAAEIAKFEKEEVDRKKRALELQAQKEQEQKEKQLQDKVNKLIAEYNLVIIYRNRTFLVAKNNSGQHFYIKDGVLRKPNELKEEIAEFNLYQKRQIEIERQEKELRNKNLAYRWIVQARAVCSSGHTCSITGIREGQRLEDGSAKFEISYESRWRSAGGRGSATIICGFGRPNTLNSTAVKAVCQ